MARAMKCDRCGRLHEHYDGIKEFKEFKDTERANGVMLLDKDLDKKYWSRKSYDLCPDCMRELEIFLNQHKSD